MQFIKKITFKRHRVQSQYKSVSVSYWFKSDSGICFLVLGSACYFCEDIFHSKFSRAISIAIDYPEKWLPIKVAKTVKKFLEDPLTEIEWGRYKCQNV